MGHGKTLGAAVGLLLAATAAIKVLKWKVKCSLSLFRPTRACIGSRSDAADNTGHTVLSWCATVYDFLFRCSDSSISSGAVLQSVLSVPREDVVT